MTFLTISDLINDIESPELCNNDAFFTLIPRKDAEELNDEDYSYYLAYGDDDPWEDYMDLKFL